MKKPTLIIIDEIANIKTNRKEILKESGYESIYDVKKEVGFKNADQAYNYLFYQYNQQAKQFNINSQKDYEQKLASYSKYKYKYKYEKDLKEIKSKEEEKRKEKQQEEKRKEKQQEEKRKEKQQEKEKEKVKTKIIKKINNDFDRLVQGKQNNIVLNLPELYKYFTLRNVVELIIKMSNQKTGKHILLTIGDLNYTLSEKTKYRLIDLMLNNEYNVIEHQSSDEHVLYQILHSEEITISIVQDKHKNKKDNGAFFPYTHNLVGVNLEEMDIYENFDAKNYVANCLIKALLFGGLEEEKVNKLYIYVKNRKIPKCDLKKLCDELQIQIRLKQNNSRDKVEVFGIEFTQVFNIGLIEDHYFIIKDISITSYAIENYEKIKHLPNWTKIIKVCSKGYFERSEKRFIDSFKVVTLLIEQKEKLLVPLTFDNSNIASSQFYDKIDDEITNLNYTPRLLHSHLPVIGSEKTNKPKEVPYTKVWIDFEAYTDENKKHIPYMCCSINEAGVEKTFYGKSCGYKMLESLTTNTILIAHNMTYDYRFIVQYLFIMTEISKGTHLISASGKFGKYHIQVKDSYNLITMPLRSFPETFKIKDTIKEVMPYALYNIIGNVEKRFIPLQECLKYIKSYQQTHYIQNCKKWDCLKFGNVDIIKYSEEYCKIDCKILKQGYETFRSWILDCVKIDIDGILTIASLAHNYFVNQKCYDGVFQISGIPQMFIQKCVVGGRTMMSNNKKEIIKKVINDFDAVSLYPSAMKRLQGFLKGLPKVITNLNYDFLKSVDGYFVEIKPLSIGIKRDFPLMSYINKETGVREFTNEVKGNLFVDKIALEDLITFQDLKFEIVRGYYFDEGFNTRINETINYLFEERKRQKSIKNPIEIVYKLIMNSGYGKSIMKPIETEIKIFNSKEEYEVFLSRNYEWIKCTTKITDKKYRVEIMKNLNDHFNIAHVGVSILSMSKRIMNEVMTLAEDNGIKLYYQDTDSIHLEEKNIKTLSELFKSKYNRVLIGKEMGQFHSDFNLEYYTDKDGKIYEDQEEGKFCGTKRKCKDVISTELVMLGKKCYIDRLEGQTEDGETITDYHIRMKGVPESCIEYTYKKEQFNNPLEMYEKLFSGDEIKFDLLQGKAKDMFKFNKNYSINTLLEFQRTLKF